MSRQQNDDLSSMHCSYTVDQNWWCINRPSHRRANRTPRRLLAPPPLPPGRILTPPPPYGCLLSTLMTQKFKDKYKNASVCHKNNEIIVLHFKLFHLNIIFLHIKQWSQLVCSTKSLSLMNAGIVGWCAFPPSGFCFRRSCPSIETTQWSPTSCQQRLIKVWLQEVTSLCTNFTNSLIT
jgi:hypothetical protein